MGFFDKIKAGLTKTRDAMASTLGNVFQFSQIDEDFYEELEESLILADMGADGDTVLAGLFSDISERSEGLDLSKELRSLYGRLWIISACGIRTENIVRRK